MTVGCAQQEKKLTDRQPDFFFVLIALMSLAACVAEKSDDPRLASAMHKRFRTIGDAVLFQSNECPPMGGLDHAAVDSED